MHTRRGGDIEVMGLMQGKIKGGKSLLNNNLQTHFTSWIHLACLLKEQRHESALAMKQMNTCAAILMHVKKSVDLRTVWAGIIHTPVTAAGSRESMSALKPFTRNIKNRG